MKTVVRLVLTYFSGTPVLKVFSLSGLALCVVTLFVLQGLPQSPVTLALGFVAVGAVYIGGSLMPLMFGRLARSHSVRALPYGRIKLLVSALLTVTLVSSLVPILWAFGYVRAVTPQVADAALIARIHQAMWDNFRIGFTSIFLLTGWLYVALWFVTSERTALGLIKALVVVVILLFAPTRQLKTLDASVQWNLIQMAVTWIVFGGGFLLWPRWQALLSRYRASRQSSPSVPRRVSGREIDLLLGTANPWVLAGAQIVPILLATRIGFYSSTVWLYYLTIFSTVSGAIAGQAAQRSRALWLRGNWQRVDLFGCVERSFWRHNSYVLAVLLVVMVAIGTYTQLPALLLAAGVPLLALGTVLSTYLGLMITRGLHWLEATLGIAVMLALMAVAVLAARSAGDLIAVIALELALACLAVVLRFVAKRRWTSIDWMLCRPDRAALLRSA